MHLDTQPSSSNSIDQYLRDTINDYRSSKPNFTVNEVHTLNDSRGIGYVLLYSWNQEGVGPTKSLEGGNLVAGRVYYLAFDSPLSTYSTFLPVAKQMFTSFKISKQTAANNTSSTTFYPNRPQ